MSIGIEWMRRLEPLPPYGDLQRGFANEVADPLWMLSRQWQLGEHTGEDAGAPVAVRMTVSHTSIDPVGGLDPTVVPIEAILEGTALDWWTPGRRVRIGRLVAGDLTASQRTAAAFTEPLPEPYGAAFVGDVDGLAAWQHGHVPAAHPALAGLTPDLPDSWSSRSMTHDQDLRSGGSTLSVRAHRGGDVDWYTADADGPVDAVPDGPSAEVVPLRLQYPGAPLPRVFQIEDHAVDIGGFPPDRSHLATALLIELVSNHSSDWFMAPVPAPFGDATALGVGAVVTLSEVWVRSTFDEEHRVHVPHGVHDPPDAPDPDAPVGPWSLFRTSGLDRSSLVVWPSAHPLTGPLLDDIVFGVDEDANLLWAVEMRVNGREMTTGADAAQALGDTQHTGTREFSWLPSTTLPEHWHPYRTVETPSGFVHEQGRTARLDTPVPEPGPAPRSELIGPTPGDQTHLLDAHAVPYQGLRLERRYLLARGTDGRPALWRQRRTVPLLGPPASHLRFDLLREEADR